MRSIELIAKYVEEYLELPPGKALSEGKKARQLKARFYIIYFLRMDGRTYLEIGEMVKKDHSTAIYAVRKVNGWIEKEEKTRKEIFELRNLIFPELEAEEELDEEVNEILDTYQELRKEL